MFRTMLRPSTILAAGFPFAPGLREGDTKVSTPPVECDSGTLTRCERKLLKTRLISKFAQSPTWDL